MGRARKNPAINGMKYPKGMGFLTPGRGPQFHSIANSIYNDSRGSILL